MTDAHEDFILQLANLPGSKPGGGSKGPRRVATAEGAAYYGQVIGTIITKDMIDAKRKENTAKGIKPAKGMLSKGGAGGGNSAGGTPDAANPQSSGGAANAAGGSSGAQQHPYPTAGNPYAAQGYPAPGIDSTPPKWMSDKPETPKLALGIKPSSLNGPNKFSVGTSQFDAPDGSRLVRPKSGAAMAIVITPDKEVHFFTENGEVEADETIKKVMADRFGDKVDKADTLYTEEQFDENAAVSIDKLTPGSKLFDADGNAIFTKTETGWEHTELGLPVDEEDVKPLFDSGELSTGKPVDEEGIDSFDWGDDDDVEISFAEMTTPEFNEYIDTLDEGDKLYVVGGQKVTGPDGKEATAEEYTTWTKNDAGNFVNDEGKTASAKSLSFVKGKLRTIEPTDLNPAGTLAKEQKEGEAAKLKEQADKDELAAQAAEAATYVISGGLHPEQDKKNNEVKKLKAQQAREKADASKKALEDADGTTTAKEQQQAAESEAQKASQKAASAAKKTADKLKTEKEADQAISENEMNPEPGDAPHTKFIEQAPWGSVIHSNASGADYAMVPSGDPYGGKVWVEVQNPHLSPADYPQLHADNQNGDLQVVSVGSGSINKPYVGQFLNSNAMKQAVLDDALPGSEVSVFSSNKFKPKTATLTLTDEGLWKSSHPLKVPDSYELPPINKFNAITKETDSLYVTKLTKGEKKQLGVGDTPDIQWMNNAPVGATLHTTDPESEWESELTKQETGLWKYPTQSEGFGFTPEGLLEDDGPIMTIQDKPQEDSQPQVEHGGQFAAAGEPVTTELYIAAPNNTKFTYNKLDGTTSEYVKIDDDTVLMPGGLYHPTHHMQSSIDKGKITFTEDTVMAKEPDGTTKFVKNEDWVDQISMPVLPPPPPAADEASLKKVHDEYVSELADWEKELLDMNDEDDPFKDTPFEGFPETPSYNDMMSGPFSIEFLDDPSGPEYFYWDDPNGQQSHYIYKVSDDDGEGHALFQASENMNTTFNSFDFEGDEDLFVIPKDVYNAWLKDTADVLPADIEQVLANNEPTNFEYIDVEEKDWLLDMEPGTHIRARLHLDSPWTDWWLGDDGLWYDNKETEDPGTGGGHWSDPSYLWDTYGDIEVLTPMEPDSTDDKTIGDIVADVQAKNISILYDTYSEEEIWGAITALQNHPHGSPIYGLKTLPDDNQFKKNQDALIEAAKLNYPKEKPKAALLKFLKGKVSPSNNEADLDIANDPVIHLGKDKPAKNAFGFTGGDFKQSDIEAAIKIIEGFDGKLYKSQLTQHENPLGTLDFNTLVGPNKDKLAQKKAVLDHLKGVVNTLEPVKTNVTITSSKPGFSEKTYLEDGGFLDEAPLGTVIAIDVGGNGPMLFKKNEHGKWDATNTGMGKDWDSDDLYAEAEHHGTDPYYYIEGNDGGLETLTWTGVDALPIGSKIVLTSKFSGNEYVLTRKDNTMWVSDADGDLFSHGTLIDAANDDRIRLYSTPETQKPSGKKIDSMEELSGYPVGSVIEFNSEVPTQWTKVSDNNWSNTTEGDGTIGALPDNSFQNAINGGSMSLISTPNELPEQFVASPAVQAKTDEDGDGPKAQTYHNFAPGLYFNPSNNISVTVFADGTAHQENPDKGTSADWTADEVSHVDLNNPEVFDYKGIPKAASQKQEKKPSVLPTPAVAINPKDIADGIYYLGDSKEATTPVWEVKKGEVTQFGAPGEPKVPVSKTKLKNAVLKGSLVDEWGNTKVLPAGHIGAVKLFGHDNNTEALKTVRNLLDDPQFKIGNGPTDIALLADMGVYVHASKWSIYADANGIPSKQDALKQAIDGIVGPPDTWPFVDVEAVAWNNFDWQVGGNKAFVPEVAVQYFTDGYDHYTSTQAKKAIDDISANFGDGKTIGRHVTGMSVSEKRNWLKAFKSGDFKTMYKLEVNAAIKQNKAHESSWKHPGYTENTTTHKVSWAPAVVGEKSVDDVIPGNWTSLTDVSSIPEDEINNYLLAAGMQHPEYLDKATRRAWVLYHRQKKQWTVNNYSLKAKARHDAGETPLTDPILWKDNVEPAKSYSNLFLDDPYPITPWGEHYIGGKNVNDMAIEWVTDLSSGNLELVNYAGKKQTGKDFAPYLSEAQADVTVGDENKYRFAVRNYLQALRTEYDVEKSKPVYTIAPTQTVAKSLHPIYNVTDQFGNKYIFKPADPQGGVKYRAAVEAAANKIARFFGTRAPDASVVTIDGKLGVIQNELPHVKSLNGFNWATADKMQTIDLAHEHLADWMLDQDDNWAPNTLIQADGHLAAVDKGRSFFDYGHWNGMTHTSAMDVNTHLVYSDLYKAIIDGKISKEVADATWLEVRKRAIKMSTADDGRLLELLHEATDDRENWKITYKIDGKQVPQTQEGFFQAFFDRKANLPTEVTELWKKIYAKAGYGDLPEPPPAFLGEEQHSGLDDAKWHETILTVGAAGSSTLVSSPNVIGGSVTTQKVKNSDGSLDVNGAMQLGPKAQQDTLNWFKSNSDASHLEVNKAAPGTFTHDDKFATFVSAAKTIGSHAEDGKYNAGTIDAYNKAKLDIDADLQFWEPGMEPNEGSDFITFPSGTNVEFGQVDQYKMMLDYYKGKQVILDEALTSKTKPSETITKFTPITLHESNVIYTDGHGQKLVKLSTSQWIYTNGPVTSIVSNDEASNLYLHGEGHENWTKWGDTPTEVKVVFKAVLGQVHNKSGELKDFELSTTGSTLTSGNKGNEYEVTLPTGEKIYFRNSDSTNTIRSQQGRLSYRLGNVKTADDIANGTAHVQQWLSDNLGLELGAADLESAELIYWREMYGVLENRKHKAGSKWEKAKADLDAKVKEIGGSANHFIENFAAKASVEEQNEFFRDLWGKHFGKEKVDKLIADEAYLPYYEKFDLRHTDKLTGVPQWTRFDVDLSELEAKDVMLSSRNTSNNGPMELVKSGGALSTEERMRVLGKYIGGMSSGADQSYGSANSIFTRIFPTSQHSGHSYIYHPRAMLRTRTYSFSSDHFGRLDDRKGSSPSNPLDAWMNWNGGSNETMIPTSAALFGDLEIVIFDNAQQLQEAIAWLKKLGLTEINGVPIEDRLVLRKDLAAAIAKIKKTWYKK